ncbi:MAG: EF-Tu/IF-2/RF-3 family GTPase [archaeon]|nr:EF-Tu/IF-2/RF-3 family GTPase [archaeon]
MQSVVVSIFNEETAKELGKKETDSGDLEFFHRTHLERLITFIYPKAFPEKIQALVSALHLSNVVVLEINTISRELGEIILAINALKKEKGFLVINDAIDKNVLQKVIAGTVVEKFKQISKEEILNEVATIEVESHSGESIADLDSMFPVKGIGTIALGFVKQGTIKKFQNLKIHPKNFDVTIRSIQKQDKDVNEAFENDRLGVALKGIGESEFSKGMVLCSGKDFVEAKKVEISFEKNNFFKGKIEIDSQFHLHSRMQTVVCRVKSLSPFSLALEGAIALRKGERIVLLDLNSFPRIAGSGEIKSVE